MKVSIKCNNKIKVYYNKNTSLQLQMITEKLTILP